MSPRETDGKVFLELPPEHGTATHFRSTWLTSSMAALRDRGHFDHYKAALPASQRDAILTTVAGIWLPMETAMVHYGTCDRLGLPVEEMLALGESATRRAQATSLSFVARVAKGAGVTPWTIFGSAHRLWSSTCKGGGIAIRQLGPKEARFRIVGFPLARYRYNRVTMRGIIQAAAEMFCEKVYAKDVADACTDMELVMRVSWV